MKLYLLLRQADLVQQELQVVIGAASDSYDLNLISAFLPNIHLNGTTTEATKLNGGGPANDGNENLGGGDSNFCGQRRENRNRIGHQRRDGSSSSGSHVLRRTFYSFIYIFEEERWATSNYRLQRMIQCCVKNTLYQETRSMNLDRLNERNIVQRKNCFRNYNENKPIIFTVKMSFQSTVKNGAINFKFDVSFDFIEGNLPFLLVVPTVVEIDANFHIKYLTLSFSPQKKYHCLKLISDGDHVDLSFISNTMPLQVNGGTLTSPGTGKY